MCSFGIPSFFVRWSGRILTPIAATYFGAEVIMSCIKKAWGYYKASCFSFLGWRACMYAYMCPLKWVCACVSEWRKTRVSCIAVLCSLPKLKLSEKDKDMGVLWNNSDSITLTMKHRKQVIMKWRCLINRILLNRHPVQSHTWALWTKYVAESPFTDMEGKRNTLIHWMHSLGAV